MPKYVSAYDLQQREGLTRQQVLELAETRPCVWKVPVEGLFIAPEDEDRIDWSKYTPDRQYFIDGLGMLKEHAAKDWFYLASAFKNAWKTPCSDPDDKLGLDNLLYSRFPAVISGSTAIGLLEGMTPVDIQQNPNKDYALRKIIGHMDRGRMLNIVLLPGNVKTIDHTWLYLKNSTSVVVDLFLDSYLRNSLFFDDEPQQEGESPRTRIIVNVPASLWAGKTPEAVYISLNKQDFAPSVIASIIFEKVGGISKTDAGRLFYQDEIDKGVIQENRTYQRKIDSLLAESTEKFTFTFDG